MCATASAARDASATPPPPVRMKYRYFGDSGLLVSEVALGSWARFTDAFGVDEVFAIAKRAFEHGVNFFDNAEGYAAGKSEQVLGEAVARGIATGVWTREDLVLSTKIFLGTKSGPNAQGLSRKHIIEGTKASLKRMQTDYIDVLLCHRPEPTTPIEETVRAMNFVIQQGWAFYWGTSEWTSHDIIAACEIADRLGLIRPIADQTKYSLFDRFHVEHDLEVLYRKFRYGLSVYSPMSVGILTGKYSTGIPDGSRLSHPMYRTLIPDADARIAKAKVLQTFAETELRCSLAQLALAWVLGNPRVSHVLVGASDLAQLDENLGALRVVAQLTPAVRAQIDALIAFAIDVPVADPFQHIRSHFVK